MSLFKKIKGLFEETATPVETSFKDVKTAEGLLLRITGDIAIDSAIQQINEDGSLTDLPDGDYTLESGETVAVLGGKIAEIATAAEEAKDANEGELEAEVIATPLTDEVHKPKKVVTTTHYADEVTGDTSAPATTAGTVEDRVAALEAKVTELIDAINALSGSNTEMAAENAILKTKNEELSKAPAAPAASFKKFEKPEVASTDKKEITMLEKVLNKKK
jgi:regulator of replication initiation timing